MNDAVRVIELKPHSQLSCSRASTIVDHDDWMDPLCPYRATQFDDPVSAATLSVAIEGTKRLGPPDGHAARYGFASWVSPKAKEIWQGGVCASPQVKLGPMPENFARTCWRYSDGHRGFRPRWD